LIALGLLAKPAPLSCYQEVPEKLKVYYIFDYSYLMTKLNNSNTNGIYWYFSLIHQYKTVPI
jgi:hypothetical protein